MKIVLLPVLLSACIVVAHGHSSLSRSGRSSSSHGSSSSTNSHGHRHRCLAVFKQVRRREPDISTTYVRWGRTECPQLPRTSTVYSGKAAGSRISDRGGGANYLCMPLTAEYRDFVNGTQFSTRSFLHGIEYETQGSPLNDVHNHDVPCSVCLVRNSAESLMIPGVLSCPRGWRSEYSGYLASAMSHVESNNTQEHYRTMFECLDRNPERFIGGVSDGGSEVGLFVLVETDSSTLPCPPYSTGVEVPCTICSKLSNR